ncbi:MAG: carbamoyltransferase HypF [Candidatus Thorarchaeota archaeon]|nr:MAG: carbamoyltransferase HypF [Candidatus Thorarchaeota archaeon]
MKQRADIHVKGIVQGVGFRPFVYRLACDLSLVGYVLNLGDAGVRIVVEGEREDIDRLIEQLRTSPPSISRVDYVDVAWDKFSDAFSSFSIEKSSQVRASHSAPQLPPDVVICDDCITEMRNPESRWYLYPFTSCAACGPRFSTITDLPYDRPNTTMIDFPLCDTCNTGYTSPLDRRYHAQTTACQDCGPSYRLLDSSGDAVIEKDPIEHTSRLLEKGAIVAIQGIGGTHLVTKTSDSDPIRVLRERKRRIQRPFAIMVRDQLSLNKFAAFTESEFQFLKSWRRPIVLVKKRSLSENVPVAALDKISPGLDTVGVMLPYAPLHHLLFDNLDEIALVMTSANPTGMPMFIDPDTITSELKGIADYFLLHDRRIHQRVDDSVVKFVTEENPVFIRRSRGWVPEPLPVEGISSDLNFLGVGPEEKSVGAVLKSGNVYLTQYIGDTDRVENIKFLENAIRHLMHLLGVTSPDGIACDLHPEFLSTELAERLSDKMKIPLVRVQHHHAHLASIIADSKLNPDTRIVCITADGYGYAPDGNGWGGDVLVGDMRDFSREGGLTTKKYPGGDLSARFAARSLVGILGDSMQVEDIADLASGSYLSRNSSATEKSLSLLFDARRREVNLLRSTSTGRFLDAVALVLGICSENSYDAECPMKLEAVARKTDISMDRTYLSTDGTLELDTTESLMQVLNLKKQGASVPEIAYSAQHHVGTALAEIACKTAENEGLVYVGFSGGVALNRIITRAVIDEIQAHGLQPLIHRQTPPGDGGISAGQVLVCNAHLQ